MRLPARLVLLCALAACTPDALGPGPARRHDARSSVEEEAGPPPPRDFGPDSRRTGLFTGAGSTRPGLGCGSSSSSPGVRVCTGFLASAVDGTLLDVSIALPRGGGPHPLVVLLHGWGGSRIGSGDVAGALLEDGFAVLRYSARGFGDSWGQVNLADVGVEMEDLRSIVGQVVDRRGLRLDPDAVAVMGTSYGGGQSWLAALHPTFASPRGESVRIRAVVPIVPWTDLLYSLLPNGRPRDSLDPPGGLKLSYVNGLYLSGLRESPERPYPSYPDYLVAWHAWMNAAEPTAPDPVFRRITDGLAGYRSIWWQEEFWRRVAAAPVPVFLIQGLTDDLFPLPEAKRMLLALEAVAPGYPVSAYLGDLGHPRATNRPAEVDYALGLVREWLAWYLKGEGAEPAPVIRAAITRPRSEPFDPADVITVPSYDRLATGRLTRELEGEAVLVNPLADPLAGFAWDPLVMEGAGELEPYRVPPPASVVVPTSLASYEVGVGELTGGSPLLIAGEPTVAFRAVTSGVRVQLNVRLFDVAPDGRRELITRGTLTLDSPPAAGVEVVVPTYGNVWEAPAGHRLRLEITNLDSPYLAPSRLPSTTVISGVRLEVPYR